MKKQVNQDTQPKMSSNKKKIRMTGTNLVIGWCVVVLLILSAAFLPIYSEAGSYLQIVSAITSFASFVATTLFSFLIYSHNTKARETTIRMHKLSNEINTRSEDFRTLQFVASNYTLIEFVDYMLMHEAREQYIKRLKSEKDYTLYLTETGITSSDVEENFDKFKFATVRIPISITVGKTISRIKIVRFKFVKGEDSYRFSPLVDNQKCLLIFNEQDKRNELVVNLIIRKESEFFTPLEIELFTKIKINLSIQSVLGVVLNGWTELYFTNPKKLEKDGANKYSITSSHFEIAGLPILVQAVNQDMPHYNYSSELEI